MPDPEPTATANAPVASDDEMGPILVPIDFSPYSAAALVTAARIARAFGSRLEVLHVVHDPAATPGYYRQPTGSAPLQRLEEAAAEQMREFLAEVAAQHPTRPELAALEPRLTVGLPVGRILEVAESDGAGMIVMGSQGLTGLPHLLLGSQAERVAQLSPIPVTIVKDGGRPRNEPVSRGC